MGSNLNRDERIKQVYKIAVIKLSSLLSELLLIGLVLVVRLAILFGTNCIRSI